ncbi:MAG TPA: CRTAC1 family protein, partial [Gemmataceae bacterium]|nr:CRTAC1 family protein [Gemmataceae bacterium]
DKKDAAAIHFPGAKTLFEMVESPREHNVLYHNNGDGTFTNVTEKSGLKGSGWSGDVAVFDYDEDGYLDVLVTNMFGRSRLYHNNRNGTFTDVTERTLGRTSWGAIGARAFDFNNDGKLDLFIVDMHSDMWVTASKTLPIILEQKKYNYVNGPLPENDPKVLELEKLYADRFQIKYDQVRFGNTFFKNLGGGRFEEISDKAGLETFWPWGIATGDFDNDGHEDVFIPSGMGFPFVYWRNYLMMNNADETFTDRSRIFGIEPPAGGKYLKEPIAGVLAPRSSRTAAVADFNGDGRLDIVTNNFNDHPYFFKNNFPRRNYVAFQLQGTKSNRDAIGAIVRLHIGKEIMTRQVNPAGGYLSQSSKTIHFGLGDRGQIDYAEVKWPSGQLERIDQPETNRLHRMVEKRD